MPSGKFGPLNTGKYTGPPIQIWGTDFWAAGPISWKLTGKFLDVSWEFSDSGDFLDHEMRKLKLKSGGGGEKKTTRVSYQGGKLLG